MKGFNRIPPGLEFPMSKLAQLIFEDFVEGLVPIKLAYLAPELF